MRTRQIIISIFLIAVSNLNAAGCRLWMARPVNFGQYRVFAPAGTRSSGSIAVQCFGRGRVHYQLQLSNGHSGQFQQRWLQSDHNLLIYNLFLDSAYRRVWGDGTAGSQVKTVSQPAPSRRRHRIFAYIPPRQTHAVPGQYHDQIIVTMVF